MTLFLWFHHDETKEATAGGLDGAPFRGEDSLFWIETTTKQLAPDCPEIKAFAQSIIIEYGALAFLERLSVSLRLLSLEESDLTSILWILQHLKDGNTMITRVG